MNIQILFLNLNLKKLSKKNYIYINSTGTLIIEAMKKSALTFLIIVCVSIVFAQETKKKSNKQIKAEQKEQKIQLIKSLIDNKTFVFKANMVIPLNEKTKALTSDFGMEVKHDSIFSYMPYFGNTYSRDYDNFKDSPMGFMQPMESYKREKTRKGYDVNIKVKNVNDGIDIVFHISKMGDATCVASFINRQSISYTGSIFAPKPEE